MTRLVGRMRLKPCQRKTTVRCRRCMAKLSRSGPPRWATLYAAHATGKLSATSYRTTGGRWQRRSRSASTAAPARPWAAEIAVPIRRVPVNDAVVLSAQPCGRRLRKTGLRCFDRCRRSRSMDPPLLRNSCGAHADGECHHKHSERRGSHDHSASCSVRFPATRAVGIPVG